MCIYNLINNLINYLLLIYNYFIINNTEAKINSSITRLELISDDTNNSSKIHNNKHYGYILELISNIAANTDCININEDILGKLHKIKILIQTSKAYDHNNQLRHQHIHDLQQLINKNVS